MTTSKDLSVGNLLKECFYEENFEGATKYAITTLEAHYKAEREEAIRLARIDELKKQHLINHFTSWGGAQGECSPKDYIDERIAELKALDIGENNHGG